MMELRVTHSTNERLQWHRVDKLDDRITIISKVLLVRINELLERLTHDDRILVILKGTSISPSGS